MTREELAALLPTRPRDGMTDWILDQYLDSELGGHFTVYRREPVEAAPPLMAIMTPEYFDRWEREVLQPWCAAKLAGKMSAEAKRERRQKTA